MRPIQKGRMEGEEGKEVRSPFQNGIAERVVGLQREKGKGGKGKLVTFHPLGHRRHGSFPDFGYGGREKRKE